MTTKEMDILQRIRAGINPMNIRIVVNHFPEVPGAEYVQVDEAHPVLGNTFSSNPEQLRALGMDVPTSKELLELPTGRYNLIEARRALATIELLHNL